MRGMIHRACLFAHTPNFHHKIVNIISAWTCFYCVLLYAQHFPNVEGVCLNSIWLKEGSQKCYLVLYLCAWDPVAGIPKSCFTIS